MSNLTEKQREILNSFERKLRDNTIDEHIWDLFGDDEVFEDPPQLSVTVEWSEEDEAFVALEHNRDASTFAQTPAQALREMATVIELYE